MRASNKLKYVHMMSDGPSSHYRNKKMFQLTSQHIQELIPGILNFIWYYTETGHGKGSSDVIRAALKRTTDRLVAEGKDIQNYNTLVSVLRENCKEINLFQITNDGIKNVTDE